MNAAQIVEAVLFASDAPLQAEDIARADEALNEDLVEESVQELNATYSESERAFEIREMGGGYQLLTRSEFAPYLERFDTVPKPSRLSGPALETLAIIAYRQPLGRIEVEYVRGVGSAGVIRTLQDRGLIDIVGRAEGLGRPLLYGTTEHFLEHFGLKSLDALPRPEDLPVILREKTALGDEEPDDVMPDPDDEQEDEARPGVEHVLATQQAGTDSDDPELNEPEVAEALPEYIPPEAGSDEEE